MSDNVKKHWSGCECAECDLYDPPPLRCLKAERDDLLRTRDELGEALKVRGHVLAVLTRPLISDEKRDLAGLVARLCDRRQYDDLATAVHAWLLKRGAVKPGQFILPSAEHTEELLREGKTLGEDARRSFDQLPRFEESAPDPLAPVLGKEIPLLTIDELEERAAKPVRSLTFRYGLEGAVVDRTAVPPVAQEGVPTEKELLYQYQMYGSRTLVVRHLARLYRLLDEQKS